MTKDNWIHRSEEMHCLTCMHFVLKVQDADAPLLQKGRCRKHAPTLNGWPVVFDRDWCGDHKLA